MPETRSYRQGKIKDKALEMRVKTGLKRSRIQKLKLGAIAFSYAV